MYRTPCTLSASKEPSSMMSASISEDDRCTRGLVQENPSYKGSGGLTQKMRRRVVSAARSAIRMRSVEDDKKEALKNLRHDLQNGELYFGCHDNCGLDFCKSAKEKFKQTSPSEPPAQSTSSSLSSVTTSREARSLSSSSSASRCAHSPSSAPDLSPAENEDIFFQGKLTIHVSINSNIIRSTMSA